MTDAWKELQKHHAEVRDVQMSSLFDASQERFQDFSLEAPHVFVDYSKNRLTEKTRTLLTRLAVERQLEAQRRALFSGGIVNPTEQRAALHTALRHTDGPPIRVNGVDILPDIRATLKKMRDFSDAVRRGTWRGHTGKPIRDVVNIGIGGSDWGPKMVCHALSTYGGESPLRCHFVSNIDGAQITETLKTLDPETTLFCVASKTFTTLETLTNADTARRWLVDALGDARAVAKHFVAISAAIGRAREFGISENNVFPLWDWVGGRYSVWSAIGLPIALLIGMDYFEEFLAGAAEMDRHFETQPFEQNAPVLLGLLDVWYRNFFNTTSLAVIPYDHYLRYFPEYLQQLTMESNGKSMSLNQTPVAQATCPVVWGGLGTDSQHTFHQLLHQGTDWVPIDFIAVRTPLHSLAHHHEHLLANCFAQSQALLMGRSQEIVEEALRQKGLSAAQIAALAPHQVMPGNRPSNTLLLEKLTPASLGALIALYEHRVFVQGVIWNIDSFDQWGVELGKQLAKNITPALQGNEANLSAYDASTCGLIERCKH